MMLKHFRDNESSCHDDLSEEMILDEETRSDDIADSPSSLSKTQTLNETFEVRYISIYDLNMMSFRNLLLLLDLMPLLFLKLTILR